jgi:hypothetical protein
MSALDLITGESGLMEAALAGWRTALIMLWLQNGMIPNRFGKGLFCCSALARFSELSKV